MIFGNKNAIQIVFFAVCCVVLVGVCVVLPTTMMYVFGYVPERSAQPTLSATNCTIVDVDMIVASCVSSSKTAAPVCFIAKLEVLYSVARITAASLSTDNTNKTVHSGQLFACEAGYDGWNRYGSPDDVVRRCIATRYVNGTDIACFYDEANVNYVQLTQSVVNYYTSYTIVVGVAGVMCCLFALMASYIIMEYVDTRKTMQESTMEMNSLRF